MSDKPVFRSPIRIVIADDHHMLRKGLITLLAEDPNLMVVAEAQNAVECLCVCEALRPDIVIMDMIMPGLNSVSAIKQIRDKYPQTQVIVLTTYDVDDMVHSALDAGAISYLFKNIPIAQLIEAIYAAACGQSVLSPEATHSLVKHLFQPGLNCEPLTPREQEVLGLLIKGQANHEIAAHLFISISTVKKHVGNIFQKLNCGSRTQVVALAIHHHLVPQDACDG